MIRQPTPLDAQLAWHRAALVGRVPRSDGDPMCGWYKRQAVKDGPWIPVRIWLDQRVDPETGDLSEPERIRASSLGQEVDPERHWLFLRPISRDEYEALVALHRDLDAMARHDTPIDLSTTPIHPKRSLA